MFENRPFFESSGVVHASAGLLTISRDTASAVAALGATAYAADPAILNIVFPDAVSALVYQHGFNLLWIGAATFVGALRGRMSALSRTSYWLGR